MRKKLETTASSPLPNQELAETPGEESVALNFVEADDTVAPEKEPSKLKMVFSNVFLTTEEEEKNEKKPRRKKSTFFVKNTPLVCGGLLVVINMLVPEEYKEVFFVQEKAYQLTPTQEQLMDMLTPLARIADRHTHLADINPDVLDAIASGQAVVAYGMELRATLILKAHLERQAKEAEKMQNVEVWRNRLNGFTE